MREALHYTLFTPKLVRRELRARRNNRPPPFPHLTPISTKESLRAEFTCVTGEGDRRAQIEDGCWVSVRLELSLNR